MRDIELILKLNNEWQLSKIKIKKAGGQTNRNYIVQCKNKKFFVRLPWERKDIVDRKTEGKNILAISKCRKLKGLIPRFFLYVLNKKNIFDPKEEIFLPDGTMVTEYIEGRDINGKDLKKPKCQEYLAKTLYGFHSSSVKFVNVYDVFRDEVEKYRKKAKKYTLSRLLKKERIKKIEEIEKEVKRGLPLKGRLSTHNDLIFENLRIDRKGRVYLLDFEYAGYNIRSGLHYDLGIIFGGNLFYKNPITFKVFKEFLKIAEKKYGRKFDRDKIYYGALTNILVMFWWGTVKYFSSRSSEEKEYFKDYVLKRAKGIEDLFELIKKGVRQS